MLRALKVLEMAWLLIGLFCVVMGVYQYMQFGFEPALWFFGGAVIAGFFYGFRRRQRKRFESNEENNKPK